MSNKNNHARTVIAAAIAAVINASSAFAYDLPYALDEDTNQEGFNPESSLNLRVLASDFIATSFLNAQSVVAFDIGTGSLSSINITTNDLLVNGNATFGGSTIQSQDTYEGNQDSVTLAPIDNGDGTTTYQEVTTIGSYRNEINSTGGVAIDQIGNIKLSSGQTGKQTVTDMARIIVKNANGDVISDSVESGLYDAERGVFTKGDSRVIEFESANSGGGNLEVGGDAVVKGNLNTSYLFAKDISSDGSIVASQDVIADGNIAAHGNIVAGGSLGVNGGASIGGDISTSGGVTSYGNITSYGDVTAEGKVQATTINAKDANFGSASPIQNIETGEYIFKTVAPIDNGNGTSTGYFVFDTGRKVTTTNFTGGVVIDSLGNVNISSVTAQEVTEKFDQAEYSIIKDICNCILETGSAKGSYDANTGLFSVGVSEVTTSEPVDLGGGNLEVARNAVVKGATTTAGITNTGDFTNDGDATITGVLTVEGGIDSADLYTDYISVEEMDAGDVYADYIGADEIDAGIVYADALNVASNATVNGDLTVKGQVHFASNPNAGLTLSNDANTGDSTITVGVKNAAGETNGVAATSTTTTIRGGTGTTTAVLDDSGFTVTTVEPVTNITTGVTKIDKNGNLLLQGSATTVGITNTGNINNTGKVSTATLAVSGASTTTGITNTGDIANTGKVSTTTLAVSGASTTTGITNTGNLTSTGNTTLQSTSGTNSVAVTNAGVNVAATTVNVAATTSAVTKGGTTSLTLNNTGATFAGTASAPVVVSGIANGVNTNDAVNVGQLTSFRNQVQAQIDSSNVELSRGIASTVAMSNIPALDTNKTFSLGVGVGHYNNSNAFAVGANYRINDGIVVRASAGRSGSGSSAIGAGAALAW